MNLQLVSGIRHKMRYLQLHRRRRVCGYGLGVEGTIAQFLIRLLEVPNHSRNISVLGGRHCLRIARLEAVALKCVKVLVREERRLANALRVEEPESALK